MREAGVLGSKCVLSVSLHCQIRFQSTPQLGKLSLGTIGRSATQLLLLCAANSRKVSHFRRSANSQITCREVLSMGGIEPMISRRLSTCLIGCNGNQEMKVFVINVDS